MKIVLDTNILVSAMWSPDGKRFSSSTEGYKLPSGGYFAPTKPLQSVLYFIRKKMKGGCHDSS